MRALARGGVDEPAEHAEHAAKIRVLTSPRADEHEAAYDIRVAQGQLLADLRAAGEAGDVHRTVDPNCMEDRCGVIRHRGGVEGFGLGRQGRSARAGVVEGDEAVAVGQAVELELPRLDGIRETAQEKHIRSDATCLDPEGSVSARVDVAAKGSRRRRARHAGSVRQPSCCSLVTTRPRGQGEHVFRSGLGSEQPGRGVPHGFCT